MLRRSIAMAAALTAAFLAGSMAAEQTKSTPWDIGARYVPAPAAASDSLRRLIEMSPVPDVEAARNTYPTDEAEWQAARARIDSSRSALAEGWAKKTGVLLEQSKVGDVEVWRVTPPKVAPEHADHLFMHLHGGGYVYGTGRAGTFEAILIAHAVGIPVISVDYRTPPEHPFPAAIEDAVAVYQALLREHPAGKMAMGGTSAGGGLALATARRLIELGVEVPGAVFAGTPWADLTKTGDTEYTNEGLDRILVTYDGWVRAAAMLYADGHSLRDPLISPVYGDFKGFPPTLLVTGTRDLLLSDTARTHRALRSAGATADLIVFDGMSHAEYIYAYGGAEYYQTFSELNAFLLRHLE